MDSAMSSLIDRAGLNRGKVRQLIGRGLDGADDGELFLEYRQAEALTFDNGRLKQATYDTAQGFGLRAVNDAGSRALRFQYGSGPCRLSRRILSLSPTSRPRPIMTSAKTAGGPT